MTGFKFLGEDFWVVHSAAIYKNKNKNTMGNYFNYQFFRSII